MKCQLFRRNRVSERDGVAIESSKAALPRGHRS